MRKRVSVMGLMILGVVLAGGRPAMAQAAQDQSKPAYTLPEYNALQAAQAEKDPAQRVKLLDDFVGRFPNSTLMPYINQMYVSTYFQLKNYPKTIDAADKLLAMGDKVEPTTRLSAAQTRVQAFNAGFDPKAADANDQLAKQRDAALMGAKLLTGLPKPANSTDSEDVWNGKKKPGLAFFYSAAAAADLQLKDNAAGVEALKNVLSLTPNDAVSEYRLGVAEFALNPPQGMDGLWALARAVDLKVQDTPKVKDYLRQRLLAYEQPGCDSQVDAQIDEMLQLAMNSPDRPATYMIPAAADLQKIAQSSTIATVLTDLNGGGDKAKMTWLAICGAQFPEVGAKVIDVTAGEPLVLHVFTSSNQDEIQAATMANMEVKVVGQPDASRLMKDDPVRFSGTLVGYDPAPAFMLHWDKAMVNAEDIPT